jgi:hypothetical protein
LIRRRTEWRWRAWRASERVCAARGGCLGWAELSAAGFLLRLWMWVAREGDRWRELDTGCLELRAWLVLWVALGRGVGGCLQ